jgi:hypothetical protein
VGRVKGTQARRAVGLVNFKTEIWVHRC